MLQCPNESCHVNLDVSAASWKKFNIFEIFEVWNANRGRTKYGIYTSYYIVGYSALTTLFTNELGPEWFP